MPPSASDWEKEAAEEARDDARRHVAGVVGRMSLKEMMSYCDDLGVAHDHCEDRAQLHEVLVEAMVEEAMARQEEEVKEGGAGKDGKRRVKRRRAAAKGGGAKEKSLVWPVTIGVTAAMVCYRLWSLGLLPWMWAALTGGEVDEEDLPFRTQGGRKAHHRKIPVQDEEDDYDGGYDDGEF